eukprot:gene9981-11653_t
MTDYRSLSDAELVALFKDDDRPAFSELYKRHWQVLYLYARKLIHDNTEAEDITQEVLTYLWTKRATLQINGTVVSYLYGSVRNAVMNMVQRRKVYDKYLVSLGDFTDRGEYITEEYVREKELLLRIENAIATLPPKMKQIFELSRKEHLSQKAIAEKLNISDKTVKKQVSNAIKILRLKIHLLTTIFPF